jgi:16S rRNA G966 N2-methylase RsmD
MKRPAYSLVFLDPPFKMFESETGAQEVYGRVEGILESGAVDPGGVVILRQPARFKGKCALRLIDKRVYGESAVLRFRAEQVGS